jgi:hypothetical protein
MTFVDHPAYHAKQRREQVAGLGRGEVIGGRQPARAGTDDENAPAAGRCIVRQLPTFRSRLVPQEALDRMDVYTAVELVAIAGSFAGMIADPTVHRGHWIVPHQMLSCLSKLACLSKIEPALNIFAGQLHCRAAEDQHRLDDGFASALTSLGGSYPPSDSCLGEALSSRGLIIDVNDNAVSKHVKRS